MPQIPLIDADFSNMSFSLFVTRTKINNNRLQDKINFGARLEIYGFYIEMGTIWNPTTNARERHFRFGGDSLDILKEAAKQLGKKFDDLASSVKTLITGKFLSESNFYEFRFISTDDDKICLSSRDDSSSVRSKMII